MSSKTVWHKVVLMLSVLAFAGALLIASACSSTPDQQPEGTGDASEQSADPATGDDAAGEDTEAQSDDAAKEDTQTDAVDEAPEESADPVEGEDAEKDAQATDEGADTADAASEEKAPEAAGDKAAAATEEPAAADAVDPAPVAATFSMDGDCTTCHPSPAATSQDETCLAYTHAAFACTMCHNQEDLLVEAHEGAVAGGKEPLRIRKAKVTEDVCLTCHVSYEALAEKTADVTVLTDINGVTVNPHVTKAMSVQHEENITCLKCHAIHDPVDDQKAYKFCVNCHHSKEFVCGACHETPAV